MRFVHTMVRITDIEESLDFYVNKLGLVETRRHDNEAGKFTLIFLAAPLDQERAETTRSPELELTYNWGSDEVYETGRSWGHLAYRVKDIYGLCQSLMDKGVVINRPPRDGAMAFIKSPDNVSIELIQEGDPLPIKEPWASMENNGNW